MINDIRKNSLTRWWVSGVAMLPSYIFLAIISARFTGLAWLASIFLGLWIIGYIYSVFLFVFRGFISKYSVVLFVIYLISLQVLVFSIFFYFVYAWLGIL